MNAQSDVESFSAPRLSKSKPDAVRVLDVEEAGADALGWGSDCDICDSDCNRD